MKTFMILHRWVASSFGVDSLSVVVARAAVARPCTAEPKVGPGGRSRPWVSSSRAWAGAFGGRPRPDRRLGAGAASRHVPIRGPNSANLTPPAAPRRRGTPSNRHKSPANLALQRRTRCRCTNQETGSPDPGLRGASSRPRLKHRGRTTGSATKPLLARGAGPPERFPSRGEESLTGPDGAG
jgi:hypothetical protein